MAARPVRNKNRNQPSIINSQNGHEHDPEWYKATPAHRAWFATGCAAILVSLLKSALLIDGPRALLCTSFAALVGYVLADLASGIHHWAVDNYGSPQTPIFGSQIESFRSHHLQPWVIAKCEMAGILYVLAGIVSAVVFPVTVACNEAVVLGFVCAFAGCVMFSLQVHAWAHASRQELPCLVVALQDAGIILRWSQHAAHHRPPHNNSFCTLSGLWNPVLDKTGAFAAAEVVLSCLVGVKPRSWNDS